jgi:tRNA threonylcarbamoyl adenosine modification protein (Sua5/YciO/YrdC/YwlC family)
MLIQLKRRNKVNVDRIVNELRNGNLVITPTDTVYGIMGDSKNRDVIEKVYEAKKRDKRKPLILLVSDIDMLKEYTKELNNLEEELIKRYMPGKLTIILKKNDKVMNSITNNSEYVGIRIPDNKYLIDIINKLGNPVISTSANLSNEEVITDIHSINKELLEYISFIYDGGIIKASSSTIIKVVDNNIEFLREGELASIIKSDYKLFK